MSRITVYDMVCMYVDLCFQCNRKNQYIQIINISRTNFDTEIVYLLQSVDILVAVLIKFNAQLY